MFGLIDTGEIGWCIHERRHKSAMSVHWKSFGEEVCEVVCAFNPRDNKLLLPDTVSNPVKMHIDTFCATGSDGVVRDTNGACIVAEDGSGQLRVAEAG